MGSSGSAAAADGQRSRRARDGTALASGSDEGSSVLSMLSRSSGGNVLLALLNARDATALRATCREARDAVAAFTWDDSRVDAISGLVSAGPRISGLLASWRACVPLARCANASNNHSLVDADFANLRGLHSLDVSGCRWITGAALTHVGGGLRALVLLGNERATDASFVHLKDLVTLDVSRCTRFVGSAVAQLHNLRNLSVSGCPYVTDATLVHLGSIETLDISRCERIYGTTFICLRSLRSCNMSRCPFIRDAALDFAEFPTTLCTLDISFCHLLTPACLEHLGSVTKLSVKGCAKALEEAAVTRGAGV